MTTPPKGGHPCARCRFCPCATSSSSRTWSCRCSSGARSPLRRSRRRWPRTRSCCSRPRRRPRPTIRRTTDIFRLGTIGYIIQLLRLPDGTVKVLVEGKRRARIVSYPQTTPFFLTEVEEIDEPDEKSVELQALMRSIQGVFENYVKLNKRIPPEMLVSVQTIDEPGRLADTIAAHLSLKLNDKQIILETESPQKRLERLYELMQAEIEILQVEQKIRTRVKKQMEKSQKEYYLNEQMQAIQKELGDRDEFKNELNELEQKIKTKKMSAEAKERALKELKKLKMMSPMSAEATVVRNYIDWILALPWGDKTTDNKRHRRGRAHPGRGPLRAQEGQGAHPRVPGGAGAGARSITRPDPVPCRPARRRQDVAGASRSRARPGASSCASRSAACATRPRSAATGARTSARCPARSSSRSRRSARNNPVFLLDEIDKMSHGLPRRPGRRAARGAGPGAEQQLQRPLPRSRLRPVGRHVHHDGQHAARDPAAAAGSHARSSSSPATPSGRSSPSRAST